MKAKDVPHIHVAAIKQLAKAGGRRVGSDFLFALDSLVRRKVEAACRTHNGGKKTLDATIAGFVGVH
jgi:hypothetical protein